MSEDSRNEKQRIYMVIRHDLSGVWIGEILGRGQIDPETSFIMRGRKIWSWSGSRLETSQIATRGLDPEATHRLGDVVEVEIPWGSADRRCDAIRTTAEIVKQVFELPEWVG